MSYEFLLTDATGKVLSDLSGASDKRFGLALRGASSASVVVPGGSRDATRILEGGKLLRVSEFNDSLLVADDKQLLGHFRQIAAEEIASTESHTVSSAWADPFWTLGHRLINPHLGNPITSYGSPLALMDIGEIMRLILNDVNGMTFSGAESSGIRPGTIVPSASTYVEGWTMKVAGEAIAELSATLDGPDFRVRPIPMTLGSTPDPHSAIPAVDKRYIAELDVAPSLSTHRPKAVFEYGDGALNVASFNRPITVDGAANYLYVSPPGYPAGITGGADQSGNLAFWSSLSAGEPVGALGLLEAHVPTDVVSNPLRLQIAKEHYAARKNGRQTIVFTPVPDLIRADGTRRVPRLGVDYKIGDTFPFRATVPIRNDAGDLVPTKRIDVTMRAYGADVTVNDVGTGTIALTVSPA